MHGGELTKTVPEDVQETISQGIEAGGVVATTTVQEDVEETISQGIEAGGVVATTTVPEDVQETISQGIEAGGVVATTTVPEDLVQKILAMVPFPAVYKARCLAKSWLARFSSIASQRDEPEKSLPAYFQKQVRESAHKWETFCPFLLVKGDSFAYHRATRSWKRMPSFSFLPDHALVYQNLQLEGALLLASNLYGYTNMCYTNTCVANVLTRQWKKLPVCQLDTQYPGHGSVYSYCTRLVINVSSETYQVIRLCRPLFYEDSDGSPSELERSGVCLAQLYDSQSDAWTTKMVSFPTEFPFLSPAFANSVHLDGKLYLVPANNPEKMLAYSLGEGTFTEVSLRCPHRTNRLAPSVHLVVCNESLMLILTYGTLVYVPTPAELPTRVELFKIDLESQEMSTVARGPPAALNFGIEGNSFMRPVAEGNRIFFGMEAGDDGTVLTYDLDLAEWTSIPIPGVEGEPGTARERNPIGHGNFKRFDMIRSSFQPGLVPFIEV